MKKFKNEFKTSHGLVFFQSDTNFKKLLLMMRPTGDLRFSSIKSFSLSFPFYQLLICQN